MERKIAVNAKSMTEWITVDVNDVNKEAVKTLNGVNVRMMFSPYDVPRLFRGYKCPTIARFSSLSSNI